MCLLVLYFLLKLPSVIVLTLKTSLGYSITLKTAFCDHWIRQTRTALSPHLQPPNSLNEEGPVVEEEHTGEQHHPGSRDKWRLL